MQIFNFIGALNGIIALIGLIWLFIFYKQNQKNIDTKLLTLNKNLNNYKAHLQADIQIWSETAKNNKNKMGDLEQSYLYEISRINANYLSLEKRIRTLESFAIEEN